MKTPKIRFKGFEGDWEEKKLGELCIWISEKYWERSDLEVFSVNNKNGFILQTEHFDNNEIASKDKRNYKIVTKNQFAYNPSRINVWSIAYLKNEDAVIVSPLYNIFECKKELNEMFLERFMKTFLFNKQRILNTEVSVRECLSFEGYCKIKIIKPETKEQEKIWSLFEQLDSHISKNQQKLEKLKNMKHSFLQKFFPKDWSALPELRFKGFEGAWEERKLGEIFEEYSEKNHMEFPVLTIMQWIGTMLRSEVGRNLQYNKNNVSNYKLVNKDDFIVHLRSFEWGLEKSNHTWIVSPAYHILHWENINSVFYYVYFRSFNFINQKLISHVYWIRDWKSIDIPWMKTIKIPYTSFKEQEKIGNFIQKIELQITKQQEKLEKLQNLKQSLLEKMFI